MKLTETQRKNYDAVFELGRVSFRAGRRLDDNPFLDRSLLHKGWKMGFINAATAVIGNVIKNGETNVVK